MYLFGEIYSNIPTKLNSFHFIDKSEISKKILESDRHAVILVKGSRGMKLEEIIDTLKSN